MMTVLNRQFSNHDNLVRMIVKYNHQVEAVETMESTDYTRSALVKLRAWITGLHVRLKLMYDI